MLSSFQMNRDMLKTGHFGNKAHKKWHVRVFVMNKRMYSEVSDRELLSSTFMAAQKEKDATLALLDYLLEVDLRKLYATKTYSSLFEYIVKDLGLSEPAAAERVNTVRLMQQVPEVKSHINEGRVSLTTASQIERFIKTENKVREKTDRMDTSEKTSIVDACISLSKREVERCLFEKQSEEAKALSQERIKPIARNRIELKLSISTEAFQKLERLKEVSGTRSLEAIFEESLDLLLLKEQKRRGYELASTQPAESEGIKAKINATNPDSRFIPIHLKRKLFIRSGGQCEYIDLKTKKRCQCRYRIQIDHVYPYSLGGKTELNNLRHLCQTHNLHAAKRWELSSPAVVLRLRT